MTDDSEQGHRIQIPRPRKPDPNRPLSRYSDEEIDEAIRELITAQKTDAWEIGKFLEEKKRRLGHGKFTSWVKENFKDEFGEKKSHQTANNYMKLYRNISDRDAVRHIPLGTLYLIVSDNFSAELRQLILDKSDQVRPGVGKEEVKAAVDAAMEDEFDTEHPSVKNLFLDHQAREDRAEQIVQTDKTLKHWRKLWNALTAGLEEGLPIKAVINGIPLITREQADSDLVQDLEKHGLMPPYKVFDEDE